MIKSSLPVALLLLSSQALAQANQSFLSLTFIGEDNIPSGFTFDGTTVGGLSGIDYNPTTGNYVAISDDRGEPRFYNLSIDLSAGTLSPGGVQLQDVQFIRDDAGDVLSNRPDPEGIRALPFPGLLFWSSERDDSSNTPAAFVMTETGQPLADFVIPEKFTATDTSGTRSNVGFESLTFAGDTTRMLIANESALVQDGERATVDTGSPTRVLELSAVTGEPGAEYIYMVDPIAVPPNPSDAFADSGLVELLAFNERLIIAMERSFSVGAPERGYTIKLYLTQTKKATDVSGIDSIVDQHVRPMQKILLLDLADLGIVLDNIEGMTFGPMIDGKRTLILVSDDNFSAFGPQSTQFIAFTIDTR
ncbi:MAG: esterase-like activity of phytase family protein [Pseudomonadota bacterium]